MEDIVWSLIALGIVTVVVIIFAIFFLPAIIEALINGTILYLIFLKAHADIKKRKRYRMYIFAGIVSAIFLAITGNMFPVWLFTTWAALSMFIVFLIIIITTPRNLAV